METITVNSVYRHIAVESLEDSNKQGLDETREMRVRKIFKNSDKKALACIVPKLTPEQVLQILFKNLGVQQKFTEFANTLAAEQLKTKMISTNILFFECGNLCDVLIDACPVKYSPTIIGELFDEQLEQKLVEMLQEKYPALDSKGMLKKVAAFRALMQDSKALYGRNAAIKASLCKLLAAVEETEFVRFLVAEIEGTNRKDAESEADEFDLG